MKRQNIIIGIFAASLLLASCTKKDENSKADSPEVKSVPVRTVRVEEKLISVPLNAIGKVSSKKESSLSFKTNGIIQKIYVNNGQKVRKGQTLAKLDLSEIQNAYNKAKVAYEKAERDLGRAKNLYMEKVIPLESLQNAQTAFDVASSDLKIVGFNLNYSTIKAPSDGLILNKIREEGELTNAGSPILEFAGTNQNWIVKSGLVDKEVVKIVLGDTANISFDAYPRVAFRGEVTKISNAPDPANGTYEVEISLKEIPDSIKKGFIAKVELVPSKKQQYKIIPIESLAEADQDAGTIYLVQGNNPKKVQVRIETIIEDMVLVLGDIKANDLIISEGIDDVNEKSIIEVL
ncbi:MAG: efflux RND transporter periplasmic adaptor subunit [Cyclobacteriaceae bacterium]